MAATKKALIQYRRYLCYTITYKDYLRYLKKEIRIIPFSQRRMLFTPKEQYVSICENYGLTQTYDPDTL